MLYLYLPQPSTPTTKPIQLLSPTMSWACKRSGTLRPDRSHGNFLHTNFFERVLKDPSEGDFDERLNKAIRETSQGDRVCPPLSGKMLWLLFSKELLLDTAQATGRVLAHNVALKPLEKKLSSARQIVPSNLRRWSSALGQGQGRSD